MQLIGQSVEGHRASDSEYPTAVHDSFDIILI